MTTRPPCSFFQRGNCAFGTKCTKSHEGRPKSKSASSITGKKKAPSSNTSSSKSSSKSKPGNASSPLAIDKQHDGLQAPTLAPAISISPASVTPLGPERCSFFPVGMCSDENCAFLHEAPETRPAQQVATKSKAVEKSKTDTICRHYKKGNCTRGDDCLFKHSSEVREASPAAGDAVAEEPGLPLDSPGQIAGDEGPLDVEEGTTSEDQLLDWAEEVANQTEASGTHESLDVDVPDVQKDDDMRYDSREELEDTYEQDRALHEQENGQVVVEDAEGTREDDDDDMYTEDPARDEARAEEQVDAGEYPADGVPIEQTVQAQGGYEGHYQEPLRGTQSPTPSHHIYRVAQPAAVPPLSPHIAPITVYPHFFPPVVQQSTVAIPPGLPIPHPSQGFHWTQFADPYAKTDVPCCKMHFRGFCQAGDQCTFRHSLSVQEYTLLFHDPQPSLCTVTQPNLRLPGGVLLSTILAQSAQVQPVAPVLGPSTPAEQDDTTSAIRPKPMQQVECRFYPLGKCRNDPCPYLHIDSSANPSSNPRFTPEPPEINRGSINQNPTGPRMCKFFIQKNVCTWGDNCHFRHGEHDTRPAFKSSSAHEPTDWAYEAPVTSGDWTQQESAVGQEPATTSEDKPVVLDDWKTENVTSGQEWAPQPSSDWGAWGAPSGGSTEKANDGWDGNWSISNPPPDPPSSGDWGRKDTTSSRGLPGRDRKGAEKGPGVCYDWKDKGSCSRGSRCKFTHDQSQDGTRGSTPHRSGSRLSDTTKRKNAVCRMYSAKGRCTRGTDCGFSHDTTGGSQGWSSPAPGTKVEIDETWGDVKPWTGEHTTAEEVEEAPVPVVNGEEQWDPEAWAQEPQTEPPEDKTREICQRFASGYCGAGNACPYLHDLGHGPTSNGAEDLYDGHPATDCERNPDTAEPSVKPPEEALTTLPATQEPRQPEPAVKQEPIHFDHPLVQKFLMSCTVVFGFDGRPDLVTVPTQSNTVEILNFPNGTTDEVVRTFAATWGEIKNIRSGGETQDSASFYVEYSNSREANIALRQVSRMEHESRLLNAKMRGRTPLVRRSPSSMTTVKVSWPEANRSAWVYYNSITKAKGVVAKLDNTNFWDRQISVTFISPKKNQTEKFALQVKNLPLEVTVKDLEGLFTEGYSITVNKATYEMDCTEDIRSVFAQCGDVDQFHVDESTPSSKTRTAFVAFSLPSHVEAACKLDGVSQDFLGQQPLKVQPVHHARYRILGKHFSVVAEAIEELKAQANKKYGLRYRTGSDAKFSLVHLHATKENLPAFLQANRILRALLQGVAFQKDGEVFWDDYFAVSSSVNALEKLCADTKFFIERDGPRQRLVIYGQPEERQRAEQQLLKLAQRIRKQHHELEIPRSKVRALLDGDLTRLQFDIGMNKVVSLDVVSPKLVIRGDSEDLKKARLLVQSLVDVEIPTDPGAACQICLQVPQVPRQLSCRHYYCSGCLQTALKTQGAAPFQCVSRPPLVDGISERCDAPVPYVVIRDVLLPEDHKTFLSASFTSHVQRGEDGLFFCPSIGCEAIYRAEDEGLNLYCPSCASDICAFCQTWAHPGISCGDRKAIEAIP